jgi:hypothetical protein
MVKNFGACIHPVAQHDNNETHESTIQTNQTIVEGYMKENDIDFKIVSLLRERGFDSELLDYAGSVHANVIAAAYSNDLKLVTNNHLQKIIENTYNIPFLTINAEELA